jgi:hypothetical protein
MQNAMVMRTAPDLHPKASIFVALWLLSTLLYYHFLVMYSLLHAAVEFYSFRSGRREF